VKLGLIARADMSGLASQTWEFAQHMRPTKTMVIDVSQFYNDSTDCNKRTDLGRYPNADTIVEGWEPSIAQFEDFLDGLDAVYTAETPYGWDLVRLAQQRGVRTYVHVNPEFAEHLVIPTLIKPTLLMAPTPWLFDRLPERKRMVPFPVATERFTSQSMSSSRPPAMTYNVPAVNFLHVIGRPAAHDRNGTFELLHALRFVNQPINLKFCCLQAGYVMDVLRQFDIPSHIGVDIDESQTHDYWDIYRNQDVLIMPRRWGGMSLPIQEAMAAGMPVILSSSDVYSSELPEEWTVRSRLASSFQARTRIDIHAVDIYELAEMIDRFAADDRLMYEARQCALRWADEHSWKTLKPLYDEVLSQ
jgi:glycosyltransferase involved in cell wall biosynthesis